MTAINRVRRFGEFSLPPNAAILGGQLVVGAVVDDVDTAEIAGVGATAVLGVCMADCEPASDISATDAFPAADRCVLGAHGEFPVTYAAAATIGANLKAAASGAVTPWVDGTDDPDLIVGYCTQSTASGDTGNAYIGRG